MKFSIVTVTRGDSAAMLRRNLDSVAAQTYAPVEHIVVDGNEGAAADECAAIVGDYAGVRRLHRRGRGVYDAINYGIAACTGDVVGLIHGNDRAASPAMLARLAACFGCDPAPDYVYGDIEMVRVGADGSEGRARYYSGRAFSLGRLADGCAPPHPSLYVRRPVLQAIGPYRDDLIICSDFDMYLRLLLGGYRGRYLPGPRVVMSSGGISTTLRNRLLVSLPEKLAVLRSHGVDSSMLRLILGLRHKL